MSFGVVGEDRDPEGGGVVAGGGEDRGLTNVTGAAEDHAAGAAEGVDEGGDVGVASYKRGDGVAVPERVLRVLHYALSGRRVRSP